MFCFSFCNTIKEEVTKPSGFTYIVEDENNKDNLVVVTESTRDLSDSFPHLENLNQPIVPLDDDETSISEESLFEPIVDTESIVAAEPATPSTEEQDDMVPFDEPSTTNRVAQQTQECENPSTQSVVLSPVESEENIQISKDEFIAVLQKIEKENDWYEKRQAKKAASSKKKSRRNKKKSKNESKSMIGSHESKRARNSGSDVSHPTADRIPLTSRN